ncbi:MAG: hypothetical protein ACI9CD_000675 [Candidatus Deianiraeaceae bacterium]|jgi:hypothetical protein
MVLGRYIQKTFIVKLAIITLLAFSLSMFIEMAHNASYLHGFKGHLNLITISAKHGVNFVNDALFFVVSLSCIWTIIHLSTTSQMQIITIYKGSFTFILIQAVKSVLLLCIIHSVLSRDQHTSQNLKIHNRESIPTMWIKNLHIDHGTTSGEFYHMKNVKPHKNSFTASSIEVYSIKNSFLTNYTLYQNPFIIAHPGKKILSFFIRNTLGDVEKIEIQGLNHTSAFNHLRNSTSPTHANLFTALVKIIQNIVHEKNSSKRTIAYIVGKLQVYVSLFAATLITFTQLLATTNTRSSNTGTKIIQTIAFLIVSYTIPEIIKVIGGGGLTNQITSLGITLSIAIAFLSRFIKNYH